jgi:hypothetical protein
LDREKIKETILANFKDIDHERLEVLIESIIVDLVKILQENDNAPGAKSALQETIQTKNLTKLKEVDGKIHGEIEAKFVVASSYSPDESRLKRINKYSLEPHTEESCVALTLMAADQKVDRGYEKFLEPALEQLAKLYPDKPVLKDHNWTVDNIVGKIYDARVENGELLLDCFFPKTSKNLPVVENVLAGIYCKVSVGFAADPQEMVCSACSNSMFDVLCKHQPGDILADGSTVILLYKGVTDAFEVSLVSIPMERDARVLQNSMQLKSLDTDFNAEVFKNAQGLVSKIIPLGLVPADGITLSYPGQTITLNAGLPLSAYPMPRVISFGEAPADRIILDGIATIKDSPIMDPETQVTLPETEVPATEVVETEVPVAKDFPAEAVAQEASSLHDKLDALHASHAETKAMCGVMNDKLDQIHQKCMGLEGMIKAVPAPVATDISALEKQLVEMDAALKSVQKTLEVNLHISTEEVRELLFADSLKEQEAQVTKNKYWAREYFGYSKDDLGGQQ